ncbi:winged helix-turn-helix domain-containing protein [Haloarchaeobius sp. DT45]|uniref:winged helix-turn-helix domain-containing protein n=1 Tax=Haloarchaeobius sp. DT45 TaxID=3446116 RepID=UPI003F6AC0C3
MSGEQSTDHLPHEAFQAIGNKLRVKILSTLVEYERATLDPASISFAELRNRVNVDDPSKFNYHLKQLRGQFVEKTATGYRLTNAGRRVVSAVHSGELTSVTQNRTATTGIDCPGCQALLEASYEIDHFELGCPNHGTVGRLPLPPGVATNRAGERLFEVASLCGEWYLAAVKRGVCPLCLDHVEVTLPVEDSPNFTEACAYAQLEAEPLVEFTCTGCWMSLYAPVGAVVARHPAVTTLFFTNGIDLSAKSIFEIDYIWSDDIVSSIETDPTRVTLEIGFEHDQLQLVLDDRAQVAYTEMDSR